MHTTTTARHAGMLSALTLALVLAGCSTAVTIDEKRLPATPAQFKEGDGRWAIAAPAQAQARGEWWKAFGDATLDDLVERAGRDNTSIQIATARLAQARALLGATDANRSPQIGVSGGAVREALPLAGGQGATLVTAGANLSYEVDLFGRLSRESQAASLDVKSREALLQSARLLAQADVAQAYFALRALDVERDIVRDTLAAYGNTLKLVERRFQAGDVAELDVARVRTELASTESDGLALDARRATLEHAIAVLVGASASDFSIERQAAWRPALPVVPPGVPSTVLARRPDVSSAMSDLQAAQARVGAAKAAWFPNITLTAAGGFASPELSDVFKWSARTWSVGALLSLPLLDGGRRQSAVDSAQAQLEIGIASYRERVLVAFKEVEDELANLRLLSEQSGAQGRAIASATRATTLSESRYRNGLVSQLDLLDAQRSELRSRRQAVQVQSAQFQSMVGLIRALGGGWEA
ncbi:efflux transporter outer membrane subunit [Piscinibacter terrae]|uniref:RND transporter n=1 Tax=Piscinibacter terrae TaxID=2496871 RepID=A0A3N7HY03_9BURK|nr:efflux transporter outer membrane subunit [Albitalea terrae]RQP26783.1 RND transporter [Albitalea terrae]